MHLQLLGDFGKIHSKVNFRNYLKYSLLFLFKVWRRKNNITKVTPRRLEIIEIISFTERVNFFFLDYCIYIQKDQTQACLHKVYCLIPLITVALIFLKTPFVGTSPSKSLQDKFNNYKKIKLSKNFGIFSEKSFLEKSKT